MTEFSSQHVLPLRAESFALLVKQMKKFQNEAEIFELDLDRMKVKGDLAVVRSYFKKPMIAKSTLLDLLKRGVKAGFDYADLPWDLEIDEEFRTLVMNKKCKTIRSFHEFEKTPSLDELEKTLQKMKEKNADYYKIATTVRSAEDAEVLFNLLSEKKYKDRLIIAAMGENSYSRELRIKAPLLGSVFYYAPILPQQKNAEGQLLKKELVEAWKLN